jgi:hypothetical protein
MRLACNFALRREVGRMRKFILILLTLLSLTPALAGCAESRTKTYLWPPAADVNDP